MNMNNGTPVDELNINRHTEKTGYIMNFCELDDGTLSAVSEDLALCATLDEMHKLQQIFRETNSIPTVQDVYFALSGLRRERLNAKLHPSLGTVTGCTREHMQLLLPFMRRFRLQSSSSDREQSLTTLAEYAACGRTDSAPCGIQACLLDDRILPLPYSGMHETLIIGNFLVTFSTGRPISGTGSAEACVILSPSENDDIMSFTDKTHRICRKLLKEHPSTRISTLTSKGLLSELLEHMNGVLIDTLLLPTPRNTAESVFEPCAPALILYLSRNALIKLWELAANEGMIIKSAASVRPNGVNVHASEGNVQFDSTFMKLLKCSSSVNVSVKSNVAYAGGSRLLINGDTYDYHLTTSKHVLSACYVSGDRLYADIDSAMADKSAIYAVIGTVSANDGAFIDSILTLDSFRRNCSPTIAYSAFFDSNETKICILKLKSAE